MVSFQCDGCADTVKKPQLDKHRQRCWSSFTCLDCSTTFQNQDYKSHTSCISEAEKYQGKLYKGPRKGQQTPSSAPSASASTVATPADSPAPSESGASTIHPSRLNQLNRTQDFNERGSFNPRGRGSFSSRGGRGAFGARTDFAARSYKPTGENTVTAQGGMRSWGSAPTSDNEAPASVLAAPSQQVAPNSRQVDEPKKKRKGDKGGTGLKANSRVQSEEQTDTAPASKKRKVEELHSTPSVSSAKDTPSDKTLKRMRKRMSKLQSQGHDAMTLSEFMERVSHGKEKTVERDDLLQGIKVTFANGVWSMTV